MARTLSIGLSALAVLGLLAASTGTSTAEDAEHPLCKDKTGMAWVLPFKKAHERAVAAKRMLLIKPVAFGTTPDGGW